MPDIHSDIVVAIQRVRKQVNWKQGSAQRHLLKRKMRGHLPQNATLSEYNSLIRTIVSDNNARVFLYTYHTTQFVTVVSRKGNQHWLVMFTFNGVLETAFVVERPEHYLTSTYFTAIGTVQEVFKNV